MKVLTLLGTRPEIIRLSRVIAKLDQVCQHVLVNTGQNFDPALSDIFFDDLGVRRPDHFLGVRSDSAMGQVARILTGCEEVFRQERPDRLLILGDTNSGLGAIAAKRMGIPVFHMEAGNRCFDDRVPEEINRRIIDHSSDVLMPYTERSRANLLREGFAGERVVVTGNPIFEVIEAYRDSIARSSVLERLNLTADGYMLVTMHRAENVDDEGRLRDLCAALDGLARSHGLPVIVSTHPRTRAAMQSKDIGTGEGEIRFMEPFGFFDFIMLEKNARCVLSDSGTVQEECAIFGVPNVTLRDVTERPETIECGSNILAGVQPERVADAVRTVLAMAPMWKAPPEYLVPNVSDVVVRVLLGYNHRLDS